MCHHCQGSQGQDQQHRSRLDVDSFHGALMWTVRFFIPRQAAFVISLCLLPSCGPWEALCYRPFHPVVKEPWDAFLHLWLLANIVPAAPVHKMHRSGRRNATGMVVYDQMTTRVQNDWWQLLVAGKYSIKCSLTSASDAPCPRGWGPTQKFRGPS